MRRKEVRTRGKIKLSRYFQDLKNNERVTIVIEKAMPFSFPKRLQGRTGVVEDKKGKAYIIKINDQEKEKRFIIEAIHLKRIQ
jgi:large subunit ribosomal protein L21e